jgi:carotenoid cleavage dioxygenase-like enzyme
VVATIPEFSALTQVYSTFLLYIVALAHCEREIWLLQVLDAADFNKGPLAKLWLKHHVPHGLHGFFSPTYYGPSS